MTTGPKDCMELKCDCEENCPVTTTDKTELERLAHEQWAAGFVDACPNREPHAEKGCAFCQTIVDLCTDLFATNEVGGNET